MTEREQVLLAHGYVLHQRPYRNTSQLVDCITAEQGRVVLVARGSRRPGRNQRALLQPFAPLRLSWVRRGELGRLTHVEAEGAGLDLGAERLLAGFYVNELLLRLTARDDANAEVFSCYSRCLAALGARAHTARTLRLFELHLLQALGYGLVLDCDTETGEPLRPDARYLFELERGPRAVEDAALGPEAHWGRELIALREETLEDETSLRAAKRLLGRALSAYLGERPLRSRAVFKEIIERGLKG
jgi:DNA repair protein RecO (recombination protein O)